MPTENAATKTAIQYAQDWGNSSVPPALLATLVTALHARPFKPLPMVFPPALLFGTYLNLSGFERDAAGFTAAWSGLYLLLARRRKVNWLYWKVGGASYYGRPGSNKFGARGLTRGAAMILAGVNVVGGGTAYAFGKKSKETTL